MWPFSEMSLPAATLIGTLANWVLLASLVGGVLSTFVIVKTTDVKEAHWDRDRESSRERISKLSAEADRARAELGKANAEIAKANQATAALHGEAERARLETARIKKELGWRELTNQQQERLIAVLVRRPLEVTVGWTAGDPESAYFAQYLAKAISAAGSKIQAFAPFDMLGEQRFGLHVSGSEADELNMLVAGLEEAGLGPIDVAKSEKKADGTKYFTHLFVGFRAPPSFP